MRHRLLQWLSMIHHKNQWYFQLPSLNISLSSLFLWFSASVTPLIIRSTLLYNFKHFIERDNHTTSSPWLASFWQSKYPVSLHAKTQSGFFVSSWKQTFKTLGGEQPSQNYLTKNPTLRSKACNQSYLVETCKQKFDLQVIMSIDHQQQQQKTHQSQICQKW